MRKIDILYDLLVSKKCEKLLYYLNITNIKVIDFKYLLIKKFTSPSFYSYLCNHVYLQVPFPYYNQAINQFEI